MKLLFGKALIVVLLISSSQAFAADQAAAPAATTTKPSVVDEAKQPNVNSDLDVDVGMDSDEYVSGDEDTIELDPPSDDEMPED